MKAINKESLLFALLFFSLVCCSKGVGYVPGTIFNWPFKYGEYSRLGNVSFSHENGSLRGYFHISNSNTLVTSAKPVVFVYSTDYDATTGSSSVKPFKFLKFDRVKTKETYESNYELPVEYRFEVQLPLALRERLRNPNCTPIEICIELHLLVGRAVLSEQNGKANNIYRLRLYPFGEGLLRTVNFVNGYFKNDEMLRVRKLSLKAKQLKVILFVRLPPPLAQQPIVNPKDYPTVKVVLKDKSAHSVVLSAKFDHFLKMAGPCHKAHPQVMIYILTHEIAHNSALNIPHSFTITSIHYEWKQDISMVDTNNRMGYLIFDQNDVALKEANLLFIHPYSNPLYFESPLLNMLFGMDILSWANTRAQTTRSSSKSSLTFHKGKAIAASTSHTATTAQKRVKFSNEAQVKEFSEVSNQINTSEAYIPLRTDDLFRMNLEVSKYFKRYSFCSKKKHLRDSLESVVATRMDYRHVKNVFSAYLNVIQRLEHGTSQEENAEFEVLFAFLMDVGRLMFTIEMCSPFRLLFIRSMKANFAGENSLSNQEYSNCLKHSIVAILLKLPLLPSALTKYMHKQTIDKATLMQIQAEPISLPLAITKKPWESFHSTYENMDSKVKEIVGVVSLLEAKLLPLMEQTPNQEQYDEMDYVLSFTPREDLLMDLSRLQYSATPKHTKLARIFELAIFGLVRIVASQPEYQQIFTSLFKDYYRPAPTHLNPEKLAKKFPLYSRLVDLRTASESIIREGPEGWNSTDFDKWKVLAFKFALASFSLKPNARLKGAKECTIGRNSFHEWIDAYLDWFIKSQVRGFFLDQIEINTRK